MAAPGAGNQVARRLIDDLVDFSGETAVSKYMKCFMAQQIAEGRHFVNRIRKEAQTARNLIARDDRRGENTKLIELNDMITQAEEAIESKEAHVEMMDAASNSTGTHRKVNNGMVTNLCETGRVSKGDSDEGSRDRGSISNLGEGNRVACVTLSKHRRLIAELEALGQRGDALRALDYMREIVARDSAKLEVFEQLLACTHVGIPLKFMFCLNWHGLFLIYPGERLFRFGLELHLKWHGVCLRLQSNFHLELVCCFMRAGSIAVVLLICCSFVVFEVGYECCKEAASEGAGTDSWFPESSLFKLKACGGIPGKFSVRDSPSNLSNIYLFIAFAPSFLGVRIALSFRYASSFCLSISLDTFLQQSESVNLMS
ncbi:hypothetical protein Tco_0553440 [Tanacetum coccineum]